METILNNLLSLSTENEVVEFKEAKNQYSKDKLGKYFSALSNEANLKAKSKAWLIYSMSKRDNSIINKGTIRYPKWVRSLSKNC